MSTAQKTPIINVITILAVLASPTFATIITKVEDCERLLTADSAMISKFRDPGIKTPLYLKCFDVARDRQEDMEEGLLRVNIDSKTYRFIAVDEQDAPIIELYKAGGMEADLIHFGTVEGFDVYLWQETIDLFPWKDLVEFYDFRVDKNLINRLKEMAAKKVYPATKLPYAVYFSENSGKIVFMSHNDLQRDDPQAARSWMTDLLGQLLQKQQDAPVADPKKNQEIKEQREKLLSFIKQLPTDKNFLDELSAYVNKTETDTPPAGQTVKQKQGTKLETDAQSLAKDQAKDNILGANNPSKDSEATKEVDQPKSDLADTRAVLNKNEVPVKKQNDNALKTMISSKDNSKTVSEKAVDDDFSYTPYIVGGIVVVGLISAVVAALLIRRKSTSGTARSGLIA